MLNKLEDKYLKIIKFIYDKKNTTYREIADMMHMSTKTIAKYIDTINNYLKEIEVEIIIKPGSGVYISNRERAKELFKNKKFDAEGDSREMYVFTQLLYATDYIKIQDLADAIFVSRSTMENIIKEVRKKFSEYSVEVLSDRNGMKIETNELKKRQLMSEVINYYWGGIKVYHNEENNIKYKLDAIEDKNNLLNKDTSAVVVDKLNEFLEISQLNITDYEFRSLLVHLVIAIERIKNNFHIDKLVGYPEDLLENSKILIGLVEEGLNISIPEYEQKYINLHISAIEKNTYNVKKELDKLFLQTRDNISSLIKFTLDPYKPDEELIDSLTLHLNAAVQRLENGLSIHNPYTDQIKKNYQHSFEVAISIVKNIEKEYYVNFNDDEIAYIALHIQTFFERNPSKTINVVIVCGYGYGTSKLLEQRLLKEFSNKINITNCLSFKEFKDAELKEDIIVSTIPIEKANIPVIVVSPLITKTDIDEIKKHIEFKSDMTYELFNSLIDSELIIFSDKKFEIQREVLEKISERLINKGYAKEGVLESSLEREELSTTEMGIFAMPHGDIKYINKPCISIYINRHGIKWKENKVQIVFFFAINKKVRISIDQIYEFFNELVTDYSILKKLINSTSSDEIREYLKEVKY